MKMLIRSSVAVAAVLFFNATQAQGLGVKSATSASANATLNATRATNAAVNATQQSNQCNYQCG
jgi:hypothetical protein